MLDLRVISCARAAFLAALAKDNFAVTTASAGSARDAEGRKITSGVPADARAMLEIVFLAHFWGALSEDRFSFG